MLGVAVILLGGAFFGYRYFRSDVRQINSIAVMPFVNDSGNPDIDYLSDGMTENLIKGLTNIPNVSVKARSSVFRYKGQEPDMKKVAADLGVQALLNGHVSQRGDEIALSLELIDASTENVLWTERYLRKQAELVSLQSEIARDVSDSLRAKLSPDDQAKVTKEYTANPDAYQFYLKGRYLLSKATPESQKQSVEYFDKAIALDPNFSLAYSGKADAYTLLGTVFNAQMSPGEAMQNARVAAENALKLDPSLAAAYTSRAWIKFRFDWDWPGAEEDFKRATALEPRNAQAHQWYGEFLSCMGRHDEAIAEMKSARDLEPFSPIISWNLGKALFTAARYDEAMTEFQRTLELDPNFSRVFRFISILYERKGMMKEAFEAFSKQQEIASLDAADLRHTFETEGLPAARRKAFEWYSRQADTPIMRALAYAALNKKQNAVDELEKAYADRAGALVGLKTENPWDSLRDEPRFQDLLRRMKFPNWYRSDAGWRVVR
jgi:TolB-like protein/Tfp pilus assembly protein PilF